MITVSQLSKFQSHPWDRQAGYAVIKALKALQTEAEYRQGAARAREVWPDDDGQVVATALENVADACAEQREFCLDAGRLMNEAARDIDSLKLSLLAQVADVRHHDGFDGPNDQGYVSPQTTVRPQRTLKEFLILAMAAQEATITIRTTLIRATDQDRQAALAVYGILGKPMPSWDDGPIDLTVEGIQYQAGLNNQHSYEDCVTLATLNGIANTKPEFIQQHMRWNASLGKYEVTLYDPNGKPVVQLVDPTTLPVSGSYSEESNKPTFMSVYEQAIEQQFGDIKPPKVLDVPMQRITGDNGDYRERALTVDEIRQATDKRPPDIITTGTVLCETQPDNVDPAKRLVPSHCYRIKGIDADGNVVLVNPWGVDGGTRGTAYYPGEVRLTPAEYKRWCGVSDVNNVP